MSHSQRADESQVKYEDEREGMECCWEAVMVGLEGSVWVDVAAQQKRHTQEPRVPARMCYRLSFSRKQKVHFLPLNLSFTLISCGVKINNKSKIKGSQRIICL